MRKQKERDAQLVEDIKKLIRDETDHHEQATGVFAEVISAFRVPANQDCTMGEFLEMAVRTWPDYFEPMYENESEG